MSAAGGASQPRKANADSLPVSAAATASASGDTECAVLQSSLANLLKTLGEFVLLIGADGRVEAAWSSERGAGAFAKGSPVGRKFDELAGGGACKRIRKLAERSSMAGPAEGIEYTLNLDDGVHCFDIRATSVDQAGGERALCVVARDITYRRKEVQELRNSKLLLEQAEELANLGSWEIDPETGKISASENLLRIYGVASAAEWTRDVYLGRLHPDDQERVREIGDSAVARQRPFEYVARYQAPGGRTRVLAVRAIPVQGVKGRAERGIGVVQDITELVRAEDELRHLSQQLMNLRDQDRRGMARELHDGVGQSLAALKMALGELGEALGKGNQRARGLLRSAVLLADGAVREVRTVSYLMHPPLLDEVGLGPALRWYARGFSERSGVATSVEIAEDFGRSIAETEITVFRIVQEALTNVHRYSGSERAEICVARAGGRIHVEVRDHGCGLPSPDSPADSDASLGVGIAGMRERVKQLNGVFELRSVPGVGTTVCVTLRDAPRNTGAPAGQTKI